MELVEVDELRSLPDPLVRASRATEALARLDRLAADVTEVRRGAILELLDSGMTQAEVGGLLGLSRPRISQIQSSPAPHASEVDSVTATNGQSEVPAAATVPALGPRRPGAAITGRGWHYCGRCTAVTKSPVADRCSRCRGWPSYDPRNPTVRDLARLVEHLHHQGGWMQVVMGLVDAIKAAGR